MELTPTLELTSVFVGADGRGRTCYSNVSFCKQQHPTVFQWGGFLLVPMAGVEPAREFLPTGF